jgi:CheY-like chemotaxis protein
MSEQKRILYIENEKILVKSFKEVLKNVSEIEITVAYHMKEAKRVVREHGPFDGYIIDTMLPETGRELTELETQDRDRMLLLDKLIGQTNFESEALDNEAISLREAIDDVDDEIRRLLNVRGGLELVEFIAKEHCGQDGPEPLAVPVIFWTARAAPELKDKGKKYVRDEFFRWFEKPMDEEEVARELTLMLGIQTKLKDAWD